MMEMRAIMRFWANKAIYLAALGFIACSLAPAGLSAARAQAVNFGINLSGGKEPVKIDADAMEMHDKEGIAILTGNVSVEQGDRILRGGKMIVHYIKQPDMTAAEPPAADAAVAARPAKRHKKSKAAQTNSLGATGIDSLDVSGKVYIKNGKQIAVGDNGRFDAKSNIMVLTGPKVVLTDGENVATGCKLTAHMDTGRAFLESCSSSRQRGRVSVIVNRDGQN